MNIQKASREVADPVFKIMDELCAVTARKAVKQKDKTIIAKGVVANQAGTEFRLYEKYSDGSAKLAGQLNLKVFSDCVEPSFVEKLNPETKGVSRALYDAAIAFHNKPLRSGLELLNPDATERIHKHYFDKYTLSNKAGLRDDKYEGSIVLLNQPSEKVTMLNPDWHGGVVMKVEKYSEDELKNLKKQLETREEDIQRELELEDLWNDMDKIAEDYNRDLDLGLNMDKNGGIIKAKDGTKLLLIKEEPDFEQPFRHLNDESEAYNLDDYLTSLYYQKRINQGQPDQDAMQEIQRHFNLSKDQIQETFDDLYNYGLGRVLTADLENRSLDQLVTNTDPISFKEGGIIQKCSIGAAIKKFIGKELETLPSEVKAAEEVFQSTGVTKVISATTAQHLQKAAKATGDERIEILADFAQQSRERNKIT